MPSVMASRAASLGLASARPTTSSMRMTFATGCFGSRSWITSVADSGSPRDRSSCERRTSSSCGHTGAPVDRPWPALGRLDRDDGCRRRRRRSRSAGRVAASTGSAGQSRRRPLSAFVQTLDRRPRPAAAQPRPYLETHGRQRPEYPRLQSTCSVAPRRSASSGRESRSLQG